MKIIKLLISTIMVIILTSNSFLIRVDASDKREDPTLKEVMLIKRALSDRDYSTQNLRYEVILGADQDQFLLGYNEHAYIILGSIIFSM